MKIVAFEDDTRFIELLTSELRAREIEFELDICRTVSGAKERNLTEADVLLLDYYAPDGIFHEAVPQDLTIPIIAISTVDSKNSLAEREFTRVMKCAKIPHNMGLAVQQITDAILESAG